ELRLDIGPGQARLRGEPLRHLAVDIGGYLAADEGQTLRAGDFAQAGLAPPGGLNGRRGDGANLHWWTPTLLKVGDAREARAPRCSVSGPAAPGQAAPPRRRNRPWRDGCRH